MQTLLGALLLLVTLPCSVVAKASRLRSDAADQLGGRPVAKIVRMLQDVQAELTKEMEDDKAVFASLGCWCKTNEEEKTKAIEVGQATIASLEASIGADLAKIKELETKRKATMDELYADQKALDQATELRMQENKAFHQTETEFLEAIGACKGAIQVLGVHQADLAQVRSVATRLRRARVQELALTSSATGHSASAHTRAKVLSEFLDTAEKGDVKATMAFLAIPGYSSYTPQSSQIFGILETLLEDFKANLADAQAAEEKSVADFEALKKAKEEEIAAGNKLVREIDAEVAALREKNAQEMKELSDAEEQLAMDQAFLADLKEKCAASDAEFEQRMKSRLEEISAVEDTIGILNSDEAFANFDKTTRGFVEDQKFVEQSSALVQTSSRRAREATSAMLRARAVDVLRKAAGQTGLPELALIAASAEIDEFTKVKGLIDKLVAELKAQQLDEVKMRDWCIDEFATNKEETQAGDHKMSNLQQKKKDLEARIEELSEKIQQIIEKMAESQKQMGLASDNRESEAADLATTIQDQRLTQLILDRALKRMKEVYAFMQQQPGAAHIATSGTHTDAGNGPARFTKYGQNAGGARVVSLLQIVIADSQKLEDEALTQDLDSQTEYEDFMKASNAELAHDLSTKASMEEALAKAKKDLVATKEDIMDTLKVLEGLSAYKGDLHKSCDFIAKNFEARQAARQAEMEALAEAKAILSGMGRHTLE
mmetsp:Transcript_108550/g.283139  ORF Transcript_108550/g.283139 Transcript_108550/m.283139 type:complete len:718 (-) Transcript_108550:65-2218(-)